MVFSDPLFLFLFLPLLLAVYLVVRRPYRNGVLLAASLIFYASGEGWYAAVMLASVALNFAVGRALERTDPARRRPVLVLGITGNLLALVAFKYLGFLVVELNRLLHALGLGVVEVPHVHLPLGISFFAFQGMAYLVDVYRGEIAAEKSPFRFALFKAFFPQLIAGPIVRYGHVARQLENRDITPLGLGRGTERFVVGLSKKVLLANPAGAVADQIFGLPGAELSTATAWLGLICYAVQIYFDFSGYSDMAIGLGRIFGFELRENFEHPYAASSVTSFWRRWHISLSTWFRDYLYIPLGGNQRGSARTYANLFIVFALCGLWHGASWNFLVWGLWHGTLLTVERAFLGRRLALAPALVGHVYTLLAVIIGWIPFRTETLGEATHYLGALFSAQPIAAAQPFGFYVNSELLLVLAVAAVASSPWPNRLLERGLGRAPAWAGAAGVLTGACVLLLLCGMKVAAGAYSPFIYFRF